VKNFRALALVPLAVLAVGGCTGLNPDLPPDDGAVDMSVAPSLPDGDVELASTEPPGTVAEQCKRLAAAVCDRLGQCSAYLLRYYYGDAATCNARVQLTCAPYVNLPGSSWSLERLRACTAGYTSGTCSDYFAPGGPAACRPVAGSLADGAACANSNQCKSALCNLGLNGCGTCVQAAKSGEACTAAKPCALGLSCVSGKCSASGGVGAACGLTSAPCQTGLYCKTNQCAPALAAGAACDPASTVAECDSLQGLYCEQPSRKCVAYKLADSGQTCGTTTGTTTICAAGGTCSGTAPARKCLSAAMDGAACGTATSTNLSCLNPASCTSGVCRVFDPTTCK
jgi:hypothetical protein